VAFCGVLTDNVCLVGTGQLVKVNSSVDLSGDRMGIYMCVCVCVCVYIHVGK
jgi:hypothetical protein